MVLQLIDVIGAKGSQSPLKGQLIIFYHLIIWKKLRMGMVSVQKYVVYVLVFYFIFLIF